MSGFLCPPIFGALTALTSPISHPFRTNRLVEGIQRDEFLDQRRGQGLHLQIRGFADSVDQVETETALSADFPVDSLKNIPKKHESYLNWWIMVDLTMGTSTITAILYTSVYIYIPDWSFKATGAPGHRWGSGHRQDRSGIDGHGHFQLDGVPGGSTWLASPETDGSRG